MELGQPEVVVVAVTEIAAAVTVGVEGVMLAEEVVAAKLSCSSGGCRWWDGFLIQSIMQQYYNSSIMCFCRPVESLYRM